MAKRKYKDIAPDEIFMDSTNLPDFEVERLEGRIEKPISGFSIMGLAAVILLIGIIFMGKVVELQIIHGADYFSVSENNRLESSVYFAERGIIEDRNGEVILTNAKPIEGEEFSRREFLIKNGLQNIIGFVRYPSKDSSGYYYSTDYVGGDGIEEFYNDLLNGENGSKITETNAVGEITSQSVMRYPNNGEKLTLTIDARVQEKMYEYMDELAKRAGFKGGAGVIMDVNTGEILSLVTYPEYDATLISDGKDVQTIKGFLNDSRNVFLNRVTDGLYTPGSIIKPYLALGALSLGLIDENKKILSSGSISVPNPYDPTKESIFTEVKARGWIDIKEALAYSSNVFFYYIGGGYKDQKGLGIQNIEKFMKDFGFGSSVEPELFSGPEGTIPSPSWKEKVFQGDIWRIGDTYNSAIGQYGFQVTLMQVVRAVGAIANGGTILKPTIVGTDHPGALVEKVIDVDEKYFDIVREGMKGAVEYGTATGLNMDSVQVAAKTGTAELGLSKSRVNSWVTGFFPYENPKYAFVVLMESGPSENLYGGLYVMRQLLDWMSIYRSEYLR